MVPRSRAARVSTFSNRLRSSRAFWAAPSDSLYRWSKVSKRSSVSRLTPSERRVSRSASIASFRLRAVASWLAISARRPSTSLSAVRSSGIGSSRTRSSGGDGAGPLEQSGQPGDHGDRAGLPHPGVSPGVQHELNEVASELVVVRRGHRRLQPAFLEQSDGIEEVTDDRGADGHELRHVPAFDVVAED